MQNEDLIAASEFCANYNVEYSFITSLQQFGLIQVTTIEDRGFIPLNELQKLEKITRLHYDLDINLEGIEAITYLLDRLETLQSELAGLQNRLRLYEGGNEAAEY